jgi:glycosyltransferase involved in cell wall biosynthesis
MRLDGAPAAADRRSAERERLVPREQGRGARSNEMPHEIAVIMPAYNAERTLHRAVDSLSRNAAGFDLLIVDDCSRVPVTEALRPLPANTEVLRLDRNRGVAGARNAGLRLLLAGPYEFIAVLDADDVSNPERLAKEAAFLRANPHIAVVGSWARYVDENTRDIVFHFRPPCEPAAIRDALLLNNCTVHSSWMVRTRVLREVGLYDERFPLGEDYELLRRMSARFEFANLPEFLVDYTISMAGLSMQKRRRQLWDRLRIQVKYFDPWRRSAWLGVARTTALFAIPRSVLAVYRSEIGFRFQHS